MANDFLQLKPLLLAPLEEAMNAYLALDDHIEEYLAPMANKVIAVRITPFDQTFYLCPGRDRLQLLENYQGEVDARLSGSLSALGLMSLSATPMRALFRGEVRIEGDTQLAEKFQRLFQKLDIDWQGKLARYTGDAFAQRLGDLFRGGRDWSRNSLTSFRLNLEEFLQEETRDLPAKAEAEIVFRRIDDCRSEVDRLEARISRLNTDSDPSSPVL